MLCTLCLVENLIRLTRMTTSVLFGVPIAVLVHHEAITRAMGIGALLVLGSTILIIICEEGERARVETSSG